MTSRSAWSFELEAGRGHPFRQLLLADVVPQADADFPCCHVGLDDRHRREGAQRRHNRPAAAVATHARHVERDLAARRLFHCRHLVFLGVFLLAVGCRPRLFPGP